MQRCPACGNLLWATLYCIDQQTSDWINAIALGPGDTIYITGDIGAPFDSDFLTVKFSEPDSTTHSRQRRHPCDRK